MSRFVIESSLATGIRLGVLQNDATITRKQHTFIACNGHHVASTIENKFQHTTTRQRLLDTRKTKQLLPGNRETETMNFANDNMTATICCIEHII